ncbi:hypothetical protein PG984_004281 [Apiospora sp. TS-2023a]
MAEFRGRKRNRGNRVSLAALKGDVEIVAEVDDRRFRVAAHGVVEFVPEWPRVTESVCQDVAEREEQLLDRLHPASAATADTGAQPAVRWAVLEQRRGAVAVAVGVVKVA